MSLDVQNILQERCPDEVMGPTIGAAHPKKDS